MEFTVKNIMDMKAQDAWKKDPLLIQASPV